MESRGRAVAACLVLSVLGLAALFVHSASIAPRELRIGDVGIEDLGRLVLVRGVVHRVGTTGEGNAAIVLMDYGDFATIRVVARPAAVDRPVLTTPGAVVAVVGQVFGSQGHIQIFADAAGSVAVLVAPGANLLPLPFVATNAARLEGHRILVRATLVDARTVVDPRHALLRDGDAALWAYDLRGWSGGHATVTGRLFLTSRGRCELFVGVEPDAIRTDLAQLASCPAHLIGEAVSVEGVLVEPGELLGSALALESPGDDGTYRMDAFVVGWDWRDDTPWLRSGSPLLVEGVLEYRPTESRWRIAGDVTPRP